MKLKSCSIGVGMPRAMGPRRKVTRGEEGMSHKNLRCSRWGDGYDERERERERERESVIIGEVSNLE